jgi:nucleoside-diphosphate-sugar epimerase
LLGSAFHDAVHVLHIASPVILKAMTNRSRREHDVVQPAIDGCLNALRAAVHVPTIKSIVITGSIMAVVCKREVRVVRTDYSPE